MDTNRKIILGLGNLVQGDEGAGLAAVHLLQEQPPAGFECLDGGTLGLDLLPLVEDCSHLLMLDAVDAGLPPGTVIELSGNEILLYAGVKLSEHQVSFQEVLGLAQVRGALPPALHLVGVQPASLEVALGLSEVVADAVPEMARRARKWAQERA